MDIFNFNYNIEELPEAKDYSPLPAGDYIVSIESAELRETRDGTGHYLAMELLILKDKNYEGRKIWDNLNLKNRSEVAERIALSRLREYMAALGLTSLQDPEQLVSGVVIVRTKIKDDRTNITKVLSLKEQKLNSKVAVAPAITPPTKRANWAV